MTELNFWRPSASRAFRAPEFSPFLFKLKAPHNAICGFAWFTRYTALPIWLAWEVFGEGNGCASQAEMESRLQSIRDRIRFRGDRSDYIGCTLLVRPVFFPEDLCLRQPSDWKARTQTDKKYHLSSGEGALIWQACLDAARALDATPVAAGAVAETRYGDPVLVRPRLGQRTFQIAVTDAYGRACSVSDEHSLPALDAGHIRPYALGGEHRVSNGLLLRADLHRLFDKGYVTVDPGFRLVVSSRLKGEFKNGRTYYPYHGKSIRLPTRPQDWPDLEALTWHNEQVFVS